MQHDVPWLTCSQVEEMSRVSEITNLGHQASNKDGRLIRLDYVFRKTAPGGALKHNQSYQTPRLLFLSF